MSRYGLPLDNENPMIFQVSNEVGVQIMSPTEFESWVWMQLEDYGVVPGPNHTRVYQHNDMEARPEGRMLRFRVTPKEDGTKDVLLQTSSESLEINGKPYVVNVGRATPRECFYIDEDEFDEGQGFVPCMAREWYPGRHGVMRGNGSHASAWHWGMTLEGAREICAKANAQKGLTPADVTAIMKSAGLDKFLKENQS